MPVRYKFFVSLIVCITLNFVLVINSFAYVNNQETVGVIAQPNVVSNSANGGEDSVNPYGIKTIEGDVPAGKLRVTPYLMTVADTYNNRVLLYNPIDPDIGADAAFGQDDLVSGEPNRGGSVDADTMNHPMDAIFDGTHLVVADTGNNRVLIWSNLGGGGPNPDIVLGQDDFTHNSSNKGGAVGPDTLNSPTAVFSDGDILVVADSGNNRILTWNTFPTDSTDEPTGIFGQADFVSGECNRGGSVGPNTLCNPKGVFSIFGAVFVADTDNNRVVFWYTDPENPEFIWGQPDAISNSVNRGGSANSNTLNHPQDVYFDPYTSQFFIADTDNNRILVWDDFTGDDTADFVLGQVDMTHIFANKGYLTPTARTLKGPTSISPFSGFALYALDSGNNRIVAYPDSTDPADSGDEEPFDGPPEWESEDDTGGDILEIIRKHKDDKPKKEKCEWSKPPTTTWIKLTPKIVNNVRGMQLTWTQYSADKITIKIDDGTGSFPWRIEKTLNDGHEFLPNVDASQKIQIRPYNHCNEGELSFPVSYQSFTNGWHLD